MTHPALVLAVGGLMFSAVAAPVEASATELDDADVAARLCPAGAMPLTSDWVDDDSGVEGAIYTYQVEGAATLCTFAIVSTDDDSTLHGTYALSIGAQQKTGPTTGSATATPSIMSTTGDAAPAVLAAAGHQKTVEVTAVSSSTKKAAKKALAASKKRAKKAYAKAGKTRSAKRVMKRALVRATKKYAKAIAPRTTITQVAYRLDLTLDPGTVDDEIGDEMP